jgi:ABC-type transport system substrate-binding protein
MADVKEVRIEGDRTLRFLLRRHAAWLPEDLDAPLSENRMGTGPFRVVTREDGLRDLRRFDKYHGGPVGIERVTVRSADTLRIAWASLLRGDVDMVTDLPPDTAELIQNDNVRIMSFSRNYQYLIAFNGRSSKLADPRVRRALNMAIDRNAIVTDILKKAGFPSTGPIWPNHWAYTQSAGSYAFDRAAAEALLESAGLVMRPSSDPALPPARLRITCVMPTQFSILERLALEVQRQLSEIGVDIRFDVQPFGTYDKRVRSGNFEAAMMDLVGGPSLSRASIMWRSPARKDVLPYFGYHNPVTEALLEDLRLESDETAIRSGVRKLQQAFLDNPPAIFLAWNERARTVRADFNVPVEPGTDPLAMLWRWGADKPNEPSGRLTQR